ncbi:MAG: hypothetical protein VXZ82_17170 [Planctomycetota bacterium]|nr:hypothetical protein [Planctomycetota bacterium]
MKETDSAAKGKMANLVHIDGKKKLRGVTPNSLQQNRTDTKQDVGALP